MKLNNQPMTGNNALKCVRIFSSSIFVALLILICNGANKVSAASNYQDLLESEKAAQATTQIYLPLIIYQNQNTVSVSSLNERYADRGIQFFAYEQSVEALPNIPNVNISVFQEGHKVSVDSEMELYNIVESLHTATLQWTSNISSEIFVDETTLSQNSSEIFAAEVASSDGILYMTQNAQWYEFACGTGAYYMGGFACWKNITYNYQIDQGSRKVINPSVSSSYLSGLNYLSWTHDGGHAYMLNSRYASLSAYGHYTLGIT